MVQQGKLEADIGHVKLNRAQDLANRSKEGNYVDFHWLESCRVRGAVIKNVKRSPIG